MKVGFYETKYVKQYFKTALQWKKNLKINSKR